ncbi:PTS transporter subunit EIIB [Escherichia coli]|nr:PTS transporter subunit EIIB [Escherichia coli]
MAKEISSELLNTILTRVGGPGNIASCGNCMTRLRLGVHDSSLVDPNIKTLEGVKGVILTSDQVQVVFGPGKAHRAAKAMSELLGVGEPLIYGVTLPRMKPFITACLGGAAGGLFIGLIAWWGLPMGLNSAFGPSGLVALPLMTSAQGILPAMAVYAGGILVAWVCGFIFTTLFGCRNVNLD